MCRVIRSFVAVLTPVLFLFLLWSTVARATPPIPPGVETVAGVAQAHWRLTELFNSGQIRIDQDHRETLKQLATVLSQVPGDIRIEGHTDNLKLGRKVAGQFGDNRGLAQQRATAVARVLGDVEPSLIARMTVVGHGADQPLVSNDIPEGRARNRRIEIVVTDNENTGTSVATTAQVDWVTVSSSLTLEPTLGGLTRYRQPPTTSVDVQKQIAGAVSVSAGVAIAGRLTGYSEQSMIDRYDPLHSVVQWNHHDQVTVGQAMAAVAEHAGFQLDTESDNGSIYTRRLPVVQHRVDGVTVRAAFRLLAGPGLVTEYDHVTRTIRHRPTTTEAPITVASCVTSVTDSTGQDSEVPRSPDPDCKS